MAVAKQIVEDISEAKMKLKSRSSTILRFLSLMLVLMIVFLSFSVTDSPILATPGSIIDLRFSNVSIPSHISVLAFPVLPKANSYFKRFSGEAVSYFSKLINDLGRIDDVHPIKFKKLNALEESSNIYHGYLKGSTGSEELDKKFEPIEFEEDEESETEPDEEEFQIDANLDDGGKVEIEGVDVLEIEESSAIQFAEDGAALTLRRLVEEEARYLSGEAFARFMDHLYERITTFLDSNEVSENLGALTAIFELIDRDPEILVLASKFLGHLARSGGAMTADEVERQVKVELEWLRGERIEYRLFAAVLILKEMAENASTVFNVHVPELVNAIWVALRDPTYYRMFEGTQDVLGINAPVHSIHGSLLAVGELLRNTGEFMMSRYKKVAEIVLRYLEHRDRLVRLSITSLLPRIAHFLRDQFMTNYLMICMNHIIHVLKMPAECASGFIALGEMAGALDGELINYLPTISSPLRDAIAPRRGRPSLEVLACVGNIAKAMGPTMEHHVRGLLDSMFSSRLSLTLVEALEQIIESIPPLFPTIQNRLLEFISTILSRYHHSMPRQSTSDHDLLEFARESVVVYLEDEDGATRKDVALCCCKLVANSFSTISYTQFSPSRINRSSGKRPHRGVKEIFNNIEVLTSNVGLMIAFLSFSVTDSPILATPGSIIDLRFSNVSIPSHIPVLPFPVLPKANSYFKQFSGELVYYFSKLINDLGRIDDVHPIKFMNLTALEESSNIYHGYLKGSTGSEKLDKMFEPIKLEEDEESETEPDEEEFQMDADLDNGREVEIEGVDVLEIEEASAIQLAEVNGVDSLEKDVEQGKHDLVELAESQSFIANNALESMIDNPKSIVKEIYAVEEAQPLEKMESPIRHDEDNVGAYHILRISSLVLSLLAGTILYVKRRSDKTLHPIAVSTRNSPNQRMMRLRALRRNLERVTGENPWLHLSSQWVHLHMEVSLHMREFLPSMQVEEKKSSSP
ncbi:hypothetical protein CQW23_29870 [Capsicum baccatum]|uniref:Serine/threonine-protein kinase TOR n=1 Tax=Capsicum baccatum TaxID=33114 RepID=A0A2G2VC47_CAPBA|nr:hypothetical protein CQW23_29870 [Capsicum baccatum]